MVEAIARGEVDLVINTPVGTGARTDGYEIRAAAVAHRIPCITTMSGGIAAVAGDRGRRARRARVSLAARSSTPSRLTAFLSSSRGAHMATGERCGRGTADSACRTVSGQ